MSTIDDVRVDYVRHAENIGANNNFNACVEHAKGEYFLLFHDDDKIDPDFVECCVQQLTKTPGVGLVRTGVRLIDGDGNITHENEHSTDYTNYVELIDAWTSSQTTFYCCNTLINTDALRSIGGFNSEKNLFQDVVAHIKVATALGFAEIPDIKASYRYHTEKGGNNRITDWCIDSSYLIEEIVELAPGTEKERLRKSCTEFLCRVNYSYGLSISSPFTRFAMYRQVSNHFDNAFPMWDYINRWDLQPRWRRFKQNLKKKLG